MINFQIGDQVRLVGLPNSEWDGICGIVVNTTDRPGEDESESIQECAVQFPSGRRWFLASHLVRTIPDRTLRFLRAEVVDRWKDLSPDDVITLNGDRSELTTFLQERYGFGLRRASVEADNLITYVENRVRTATAV